MSASDEPSARNAALAALGHGGGPLAVGGLDAGQLVERFGSPLYAYDAGVLRARIGLVRAAFGERIGVLFALKANPSLALAAVARAAGAGAEVASAGELLIARAAGFAGGAIQLAGPGKSAADLVAAIEGGARVNLESAGEHDRLCSLAEARGARPEVAIRVNPMVAQDGARLRMADASSRFGVDADRVAALARAIAARGVCRLAGLHQYGGSQCFDAAAWVASAEGLVALSDEVGQALGGPLRSLNFGGGFGWPTYDGDPTFDLDAAASGMAALLERRPDVEAFVELGRFLVAPAGVFLCRVVDVKDSGGKRHAVLDGGMHQFGAAAGLGAVMRRAYPIVHAARPGGGGEPVSLGGPLCTPADRFGKDLVLPRLAAGDVVAVLNAGAYGLTFSPLAFLGHPAPAEVLVDGGDARVVRARGEPADALRGQRR